MPVLAIPRAGRLNYEVAADVVTALAIPDASTEEKTVAGFLLCGWFAQRFSERLVVGTFAEPIDLLPQHVWADSVLVGANAEKLGIALQHRLRAGRICLGVLGGLPGLALDSNPEGLADRTIEQVIWFCADADEVNSDNLKKRSWRPSKKVLALAAAWADLAQSWARRGSFWTVFDLMLYEKGLAELMHRAWIYERAIDVCKPLRFVKNDLTRITFVEPM